MGASSQFYGFREFGGRVSEQGVQEIINIEVLLCFVFRKTFLQWQPQWQRHARPNFYARTSVDPQPHNNWWMAHRLIDSIDRLSDGIHRLISAMN